MVKQRCEASDHRARQCGRPGSRLIRHLGWQCKDHDPERLDPRLGQICAAEGCEAAAEHYDDSFGLWYCPQHVVEEWRGACTALVQTLYPCVKEAIDLYHFDDDRGHDPDLWLCKRHHWQYTQAGGPKREIITLDWRSLGYPEMLDSPDDLEPLEDSNGIDGVVDWERIEIDGSLTRFVLSRDTGGMWGIHHDLMDHPDRAEIVAEGSDVWTAVNWQAFGVNAGEVAEATGGLHGYVSWEKTEEQGGTTRYLFSRRTNRLWLIHLDQEGQVDSVEAGPEDLSAEDIC